MSAIERDEDRCRTGAITPYSRIFFDRTVGVLAHDASRGTGAGKTCRPMRKSFLSRQAIGDRNYDQPRRVMADSIVHHLHAEKVRELQAAATKAPIRWLFLQDLAGIEFATLIDPANDFD